MFYLEKWYWHLVVSSRAQSKIHNRFKQLNGRRDVCFIQCGTSKLIFNISPSWTTCFPMPSSAAIRHLTLHSEVLLADSLAFDFEFSLLLCYHLSDHLFWLPTLVLYNPKKLLENLVSYFRRILCIWKLIIIMVKYYWRETTKWTMYSKSFSCWCSSLGGCQGRRDSTSWWNNKHCGANCVQQKNSTDINFHFARNCWSQFFNNQVTLKKELCLELGLL